MEMPHEWLVSRVCEEFGCLPSEAVHELEECDAVLVLDILELRAFVRAKDQLEMAQQTGQEVIDTPMVRQVREIMSGPVLEDQEQREALLARIVEDYAPADVSSH